MNINQKAFRANGFVVIPNFITVQECAIMHQRITHSLTDPGDPYELESTVGYPGAPSPKTTMGKTAIRRLLDAYSRDPLWKEFAHNPKLLQYIRTLLGSDDISLTRSHHNCLMTKMPKWSSYTAWHQDIRYWSFEKPNLINAWLSITAESKSNGCLQVIPGSHQIEFSKHQFDEQQFFRHKLTDNQSLLKQAIALESNPGDLLLFDSRLLHSAQSNQSNKPKFSLVFSYKLKSNKALADTKSSALDEVNLDS